METVADDLEFPTNLAFAPDGRMFFTEKNTGRVRIIEDGRLLPDPFVELDVEDSGESGLLGIALDPRFSYGQPWVYLYYTSPERNRLIRVLADQAIAEEERAITERALPV